MVDRDANIIGYIVEKLHSFWGPISQEQRFFKLIIKEMGRLFKIVPYAIFYNFIFKIGSQRAHARDMLAFFLEGTTIQQMIAGFKLLIEDKAKLTEFAEKALTYGIRF